MLNVLDTALTKSKHNITKTKVIVVNRTDQHNTTNIKIRDEPIEQIKKFCYLGGLIIEDSISTKEDKRSIALAKQIFEKKRITKT